MGLSFVRAMLVVDKVRCCEGFWHVNIEAAKNI